MYWWPNSSISPKRMNLNMETEISYFFPVIKLVWFFSSIVFSIRDYDVWVGVLDKEKGMCCYWFWGVCMYVQELLDNMWSVEDFPLSKLHSLPSWQSRWILSVELYCIIGWPCEIQGRHTKAMSFGKIIRPCSAGF